MSRPTHCKLLIDGYNLIYAIGLLPAVTRRAVFPPGRLEDARTALLQLLTKDLTEMQRRNTTIVFDALEPPQFLPDSFHHREMKILFARGYNDADELMNEQILAAERGASWVVISSDHRIQAAAARRRMTFYDSDEWYYEGLPMGKKGTPKRRSNRVPSDEEEPEKPTDPETEYWSNIFKEPE